MQGRVEGLGAFEELLSGVGGLLLPRVGVVLRAALSTALTGVFFTSGLKLKEDSVTKYNAKVQFRSEM